MAGGMPKVVGLTGGIAAGKSAARSAFELLNVPCIDFDTVTRSIHQDPAHPATRQLAKTFAAWMTEEGALQRGSLRALFARDATANRALIDLLKPYAMDNIRKWTALQHAPYVVWESALLMQEEIAVDRLLIVEAPLALRIARIKSRNPDWSEQHIADILAMQAITHCSHIAQADTIRNDGTPESLQEQIASMHHRYTTLWS